MSEDCIFCKIIDGEIESQVLYEDEKTFVMLDAKPISPGHAMVLPKTHVRDVLQLPDKDLEPFMRSVKKTASMIEDTLEPDGFTMGINHRVGQAIDHLHFHIIPRWEDDGGTSLHGVVDNRPEESLEDIRDKIVSGS